MATTPAATTIHHHLTFLSGTGHTIEPVGTVRKWNKKEENKNKGGRGE
jgi:hypothetical protein